MFCHRPLFSFANFSFSCSIASSLWGNRKRAFSPVYDKKLRRNFHKLPDEAKFTAWDPGKVILRFPHGSFIFIRGAAENQKFGKKSKYRSRERRFRYRKKKFSAGTMVFLREKSRIGPRIPNRADFGNAVYVSKTAHNVAKRVFELTVTNRSQPIRNGEFRRKLDPETPRRTRRKALRGESPAGSFFAQPSNWGEISGKQKSAICRSHGAGLRKTGGADGSWTHDLYDAKVHECAIYQWDIKVLRNFSVIPVFIWLHGGACFLL